MVEISIQKNFPIPFQGLDPDYDGETASAALQRAFRTSSLYLSSIAQGNVSLKPGSVGTPQLLAGSVTKDKLAADSSFSIPQESKTLFVTEVANSSANVGTDLDPRVRYVGSAAGSGLATGVALQRFRITDGLTMMPFMTEHIPDAGEEAVPTYDLDSLFRLWYGFFLIDIPHNLGHIPTGLIWQGGTSGTESTGGGHVLKIKKTSSGGVKDVGLTDGEEVHGQLGFKPILGKTREEIIQAAKGIYGLNQASHSVVNARYAGDSDIFYGASNVNVPFAPWAASGLAGESHSEGFSFPNWVPDRMMTTNKHYSGLVYLSINKSVGLRAGGAEPWGGLPTRTKVDLETTLSGYSEESRVNTNFIDMMVVNQILMESGTLDWVIG